MSYKLTDNTRNVENQLKLKGSIFLRTVADEIVKTSTPNTPKDKGNLRRDILKQVLGLRGKITWGKHYAVFQETKKYQNYTTPGTGPKYAENAVKSVSRRTGAIVRRVF